MAGEIIFYTVISTYIIIRVFFIGYDIGKAKGKKEANEEANIKNINL